MQYRPIIDETSKEIAKENLGMVMKIGNVRKQVKCLLWVVEVLLAENGQTNFNDHQCKES